MEAAAEVLLNLTDPGVTTKRAKGKDTAGAPELLSRGFVEVAVATGELSPPVSVVAGGRDGGVPKPHCRKDFVELRVLIQPGVAPDFANLWVLLTDVGHEFAQ